MSDYQSILERVNARQSGDRQWMGRCPAHEDSRSSLALKLTAAGRLVVFCHAGCDLQSITKAIGLPLACYGLPEREGRVEAAKPKLLATYPYANEHGELLYEVLRFEPKDFRVRRPAPGGGWIWNLDATPRVLYRYPELLAKSGHGVIIVEGEKDVDNLRKFGLVATCNNGGAGKFTLGQAACLRGRRCVILPDNDQAGWDHAMDVAGKLLWGNTTASVRIVCLAGLPPKGDVSDWLAAGGTKDELLAAIKATPEYKLTGDVPAQLGRAA